MTDTPTPTLPEGFRWMYTKIKTTTAIRPSRDDEHDDIELTQTEMLIWFEIEHGTLPLMKPYSAASHQFIPSQLLVRMSLVQDVGSVLHPSTDSIQVTGPRAKKDGSAGTATSARTLYEHQGIPEKVQQTIAWYLAAHPVPAAGQVISGLMPGSAR